VGVLRVDRHFDRPTYSRFSRIKKAPVTAVVYPCSGLVIPDIGLNPDTSGALESTSDRLLVVGRHVAYFVATSLAGAGGPDSGPEAGGGDSVCTCGAAEPAVGEAPGHLPVRRRRHRDEHSIGTLVHTNVRWRSSPSLATERSILNVRRRTSPPFDIPVRSHTVITTSLNGE